jgi:hypothetical protein
VYPPAPFATNPDVSKAPVDALGGSHHQIAAAAAALEVKNSRRLHFWKSGLFAFLGIPLAFNG